eukprot:gnl/MRDRNA2_/MRDRNA2_33387_c0_seq1.p1 gnl/MRDRNA2_/MRDRNA2_33387_c0~~gnl/MRDRNA2_/MRDRNA2_33387_c0_seq1.p1  ORF type:complete len:562 (-),score=117.79 gnl/MRDRNA2_/MRDRNA2_33387_c0_seq1:100-1569(-)
MIPVAHAQQKSNKADIQKLGFQDEALFLRMCGDYLRYICKFTHNGVRSRADTVPDGMTNVQAAEKAYLDSLEICRSCHSPLDMTYITCLVNYVLFLVEVKRDYPKAIEESKKNVLLVYAEEEAKKAELLVGEEFEMPVSAHLGVQLMKRNERVLCSELIISRVVFERLSFRTVLKRLSEMFPSIQETPQSARSPKASRHASKQSQVSGSKPPAKMEKFRLCGGLCGDTLQGSSGGALTEECPELRPPEAVSQEKGSFPAEKMVQLWLKSKTMQAPGVRWVLDCYKDPDAKNKFTFQIAARVNLDLIEKKQSENAAGDGLRRDRRHKTMREDERRQTLASDPVLNAISMDHGALQEMDSLEGIKIQEDQDEKKEDLTVLEKEEKSGKEVEHMEDEGTTSNHVVPLKVDKVEVITSGPFCEVQEHFKGLDDPFMQLQRPEGTRSYNSLIRRLSNFAFTQISKGTSTQSATINAYCLSARRNPFQAAERGAK